MNTATVIQEDPEVNPYSEILECGHNPSRHNYESFTPGWGKDDKGNRHCYECCADQDRAYMIKHGKIALYLSDRPEGGHKVSNWPGSLEFWVTALHKGNHNWAGTRYDVYFIGPDKHWWHGVQYGENTQILHCKRMKSRRG